MPEYKNLDVESLKSWFVNEKRDLPWRNNPTPYKVWVSEIMLQQTRASVVIPYFLRWMEKFPSIEHLAEAELDAVIKVWEGLGYYSRARSLHQGAQYVLKEHQGILPDTKETLGKIKGIGPYTAGAILSFAFHKKAAAVDGNVLRVISRYFGITEDISKEKTINSIRNLIEVILPDSEPWIINEALIELGATLCSRTPCCSECPLKQTCVSYAKGKTLEIPFKSSKIKKEKLYRSVAVISCQQSILIIRQGPGKIMSDLHEFPYFETSKTDHSFKKLMQKFNGAQLTLIGSLSEVKHAFTRFQVTLRAYLFSSEEKFYFPGGEWKETAQIHELAFSSGHRRLLHQITRKIPSM